MSAADPLSAEHGPLVNAGETLIGHLTGFHERLRSGDVSHHQHSVFAQRARSLAIYLDAALAETRANRYAPALAILRGSLEHHVVDLLLFLARRYVVVVREVKEATWEQWQADRAGRAEWTLPIASWRRSAKGTVTIVRTGLHQQGGSVGPRARALSIYYFLLDEFDPFSGKPFMQDQLTRGFFGLEAHVTRAKRTRDLYEQAFSWSALKDNVLANGLLRQKDWMRLDIHYSFLSAFVHATKRGMEILYERSWIGGKCQYDHYSSELALLYINVLAAAELRALHRMSRRHPRVSIDGWAVIDADISCAEKVSNHLWFPPHGKPHQFDRVEEANHRSVRRGVPIAVRDRIAPGDVSDRMVRYYRNPLDRLVRMHHSFQEGTTGIGYRSPWERQDGQFGR